MKKKYKIQKVLLFMFYLCFANMANSYCQTKVVEIDLETNSLVEGKSKIPFDEPFTIKFNNTKPGNIYKVVITDVILLRDSFTATQTSKKLVCNQYIPPNHYFNIDIKQTSVRPLNATERKDLQSKFGADDSFNEEARNMFYNASFYDMKISSFNPIIKKYFTQWGLTNYKIDLSEIEDAELQFELGNTIRGLFEIGAKVEKLNKFLKEKKIKGYNSTSLENLIKKHDDEKIYPDFKDGTTEEYIQKLDAVAKTVLNNIDTSDKELIKKIKFEFEHKTDTVALYKAIKQIGITVKKLIEQTLQTVIINNTNSETILGSNVVSPNSDCGLYTSQTFGYGYSPGTDNGLLYFAFSFYLRPVNNDVPFSNINIKDRWKAKVCINVGLTLNDISTNKNGKISGLGATIFNERAGLLGIGYRPWPYLKIDANALMYYLNDPNPLINHKKFVCSPFLGISVNLNILKILTGQPNSLTSLKQQLTH
jgi:hypothetical protein